MVFQLLLQMCNGLNSWSMCSLVGWLWMELYCTLVVPGDFLLPLLLEQSTGRGVPHQGVHVGVVVELPSIWEQTELSGTVISHPVDLIPLAVSKESVCSPWNKHKDTAILKQMHSSLYEQTKKIEENAVTKWTPEVKLHYLFGRLWKPLWQRFFGSSIHYNTEMILGVKKKVLQYYFD